MGKKRVFNGGRWGIDGIAALLFLYGFCWWIFTTKKCKLYTCVQKEFFWMSFFDSLMCLSIY